ncbi:mannosyltransferase, partial [Cladochytrium tenue]
MLGTPHTVQTTPAACIFDPPPAPRPIPPRVARPLSPAWAADPPSSPPPTGRTPPPRRVRFADAAFAFDIPSVAPVSPKYSSPSPATTVVFVPACVHPSSVRATGAGSISPLYPPAPPTAAAHGSWAELTGSKWAAATMPATAAAPAPVSLVSLASVSKHGREPLSSVGNRMRRLAAPLAATAAVLAALTLAAPLLTLRLVFATSLLDLDEHVFVGAYYSIACDAGSACLPLPSVCLLRAARSSSAYASSVYAAKACDSLAVAALVLPPVLTVAAAAAAVMARLSSPRSRHTVSAAAMLALLATALSVALAAVFAALYARAYEEAAAFRSAAGPSSTSSVNVVARDMPAAPPSSTPATPTPRFTLAFHALLLARLVAAALYVIADCDEVYNYWEPTHFLIYGRGFQTWEYSPEFSIRSWAYVSVHAGVGWLAKFFLGASKQQVFYTIRCALGLASAFAETSLYYAVSSAGYPRAAKYLLLFLLFSTGMFVSSTAYLPSSFAMYFATLALAVSFRAPSNRRAAAIVVLTAIGALLGWPFAAAASIPLALEQLVSPRRVSRLAAMVVAAIVSLVIVAGSMAVVDHAFYRKWTLVPWNIVAYNVFSGSDRGPDIFGTEPWYYYLMNGLLNFNPHKEERFLFVAYPALCLNAAVAITSAQALLERGLPPLLGRMASKILGITFAAAFLAASVSRSVALVRHYGAPIDVFARLQTHTEHRGIVLSPAKPVSATLNANTTICLGAEWYRFPSHFHLPASARVLFLPPAYSGFDGLLPRYFPENTEAGATQADGGSGAWAARMAAAALAPPVGAFNDRNRAAPADDARYATDLHTECDWVVRLVPAAAVEAGSETVAADGGGETGLGSWPPPPTPSGEATGWCEDFLDAPATTGLLARALWLPGGVGGGRGGKR